MKVNSHRLHRQLPRALAIDRKVRSSQGLREVCGYPLKGMSVSARRQNVSEWVLVGCRLPLRSGRTHHRGGYHAIDVTLSGVALLLRKTSESQSPDCSSWCATVDVTPRRQAGRDSRGVS